jgi:hypothetical protein
VKDIFDPLIIDIERLVSEQVNLVKIKRAEEYHERGDEIKAGNIAWMSEALLTQFRLSSLLADLDRASISNAVWQQHIQKFK